MRTPPLPSAESTRAIALSSVLTAFEQITSVFEGWQGQIEQVSGGRFEGQVRAVGGQCLRAVAADGTQRLRLRGRDASSQIAFYPMTARMSRCTWNQAHLAPGQILLVGVQGEIDVLTERRFSGGVLFCQPEAFAAYVRLLLNRDDLTVTPNTSVCTPSPESFANLERRQTQLLDRALKTQSFLETPDAYRLEQECLSALVGSVFPAVKQDPLPLVARFKLVDQVEEFLRSRLGGEIGILDLCRETGLSDRTIRLAVKEAYGVGPMTYYRYLRLNAVRSRLRSDPQVGIQSAAREFGFHHMGISRRTITACSASVPRKPTGTESAVPQGLRRWLPAR